MSFWVGWALGEVFCGSRCRRLQVPLVPLSGTPQSGLPRVLLYRAAASCSSFSHNHGYRTSAKWSYT